MATTGEAVAAAAYVPVETLANVLDSSADADGQWNGADVCDALFTIVDKLDGWKQCEAHGYYSAAKEQCPFQHYELEAQP